jgi:hypothetical protein
MFPFALRRAKKHPAFPGAFRRSETLPPPFSGVSFGRHGSLPTVPGMFSGAPDKPSTESGILPGSWRSHPLLSGVLSGSRERRSNWPGPFRVVRERPPESWCVFSGSPETVSTTSGIFSGSPDDPSTNSSWLEIFNLRSDNGRTRFRYPPSRTVHSHVISN